MAKSNKSKYFTSKNNNAGNKNNCEDDLEVQVNIESPYKNLLNDIKRVDLNSSNEANDFKIPKCLNNKSNIPSKKDVKKVLIKIKKPSHKRSVSNKRKGIKIFEKNSEITDTNIDHLQTAIALSKSLQDESHVDNVESNHSNTANSNTKISFTSGLDQFVFKRSNGKIEVQNRRSLRERKKNKSKLRYITPVLLLRTQEDREKIICNKVSLILSHDIKPTHSFKEKYSKPLSDYLQNQFNDDQKIFKKSRYTVEDTFTFDFYVKALNLDQSDTKCGFLLKDWHAIPGRAISPVHIVENFELSVIASGSVPEVAPILHTESNASCEIENNMKVRSITSPHAAGQINNCHSPDLFDSDEENLHKIIKDATSPIISKRVQNLKNQSINNLYDDEYSESLLNLTPTKRKFQESTSLPNFEDNFLDVTNNIVFEKDNGVCIYEKFSEHESDIDLTQSSDDEICDVKVHSLKTGISERFNDSLSLTVKSPETTDYLYEMLNNKVKTKSNELHEHKELYVNNINLSCLTKREAKNQVYDLTASSESEVERANMDTCSSSAVGSANDPTENKDDTINRHSSFVKYDSFNSTKSDQSIYISDDEINYSCVYSTPTSAQNKGKFSKRFIYGIKDSNSVDYGIVMLNSSFNASSYNNLYCEKLSQSPSEIVQKDNIAANLEHEETILYTIDDNSAKNNEATSNDSPSTPKTAVIVKSDNVTPMTNYSEMNTPKIVKELEKYGLKPLKRQRGIKLLNYIYETTHPLVGSSGTSDKFDSQDTDHERKLKRKRSASQEAIKSEIGQVISDGDKKTTSDLEPKRIVGDILRDSSEELIFERKQSKRIFSCRVPLHIAWHNLVASDTNLQRNILLYEPLQLEVVYRSLKQHGYKYHIKDLLTFFDKKCITIRTEQNSRQRHKKQKNVCSKT